MSEPKFKTGDAVMYLSVTGKDRKCFDEARVRKVERNVGISNAYKIQFSSGPRQFLITHASEDCLFTKKEAKEILASS